MYRGPKRAHVVAYFNGCSPNAFLADVEHVANCTTERYSAREMSVARRFLDLGHDIGRRDWLHSCEDPTYFSFSFDLSCFLVGSIFWKF